ncbi:hypothetical protein Nham_1908 [Nitrobacter hamburgensis X14]|uniref:Uncharacterized protein n=1 Tax=Nitrobacter hamburgensis (strain DSM 10229 / NCIMB 13809 / X14) TaxID=323097 RepID=Q1QM31_NITHX|nr:hypothetical protein Nham_1908 [Nitrobacter hamburgensis X14]
MKIWLYPAKIYHKILCSRPRRALCLSLQSPVLPSEGDFSMQRYVHEENILLYRKLLADTMDEQKRKIILKLLAEEEAKELPTPCPEKK